jgi:glycosyltransferase involved in cell wall biosynthesis
VRVLFHYPIFNAGGAEMSMLRLMKFLVSNGWSVDLVLTTGGGILESRIDSRVNISYLRDRPAGTRFAKAKGPLNKLRYAITDLVPYSVGRLQQALRQRRYRSTKYDAAIISLQGLSPEFCCKWVNASKRIQWIRNDLASSDTDGKAARNIKQYAHQIDAYVCVSGSSHQSLIDLYPELVSKASVLYNVIDAEAMRESATQAPDPYSQYGGGLKVVTVCRLADKAKGLYRMLSVHQKLLSEGFIYKWFVVGDGPDRDELKRRIHEAGVQDSFVLLGHQSNPFPYYKHADISATLSYYEGLCGSVNEAKVMGKPVIATVFSGVREQLTDDVNGIIVDNDEEAILAGFRRLLNDVELRARLSNDILPQAILDDHYKLEQLTQLIRGSSK